MQTKTWIKFTLGLTILANILQMVGFVAPMWIWIQVKSFTAGVGLWYASGCGIKGSCSSNVTVSYSYSVEDTFRESDWKAIQALETFGTAGGILVLLFLILYRIGYSKWRYLHYLHLALFITCIFTWLFILIGVLVFCISYWPVVGTSPLISSHSFPWSMLMCLIAGVLFILICVFVRLKCWDSDFVKHAIPISGDARMDLHPVTKQGFWHRYFTPAYHETRRPNYAVPLPNEGMGGFSTGGLLINGRDERRAISAIDNMAFEGSPLETGSNYRYLPPANMDPIPRPHTNAIARQSAIYDDYNRFSQDPRTFASDPGNRRLVGDLPPHRDYPRDPGVKVTRESGYYTDGGAAMTRDMTYASRYVTATREPSVLTSRELPSYYDGGAARDDARYVPARQTSIPATASQMESQDRYVTRIDIASPPITSTRSYVAGLSDPHRDIFLAHKGVDSRFTSDGRLTANADYLSAEYRRSDRPASQVGSNVSAGALQYTTHVGPLGPATRSVLSGAGGSGAVHPTYIYRPSSQQVY